MFGWSPETWGDFGVVGILVVIVFLTALALTAIAAPHAAPTLLTRAPTPHLVAGRGHGC